MHPLRTPNTQLQRCQLFLHYYLRASTTFLSMPGLPLAHNCSPHVNLSQNLAPHPTRTPQNSTLRRGTHIPSVLLSSLFWGTGGIHQCRCTELRSPQCELSPPGPNPPVSTGEHMQQQAHTKTPQSPWCHGGGPTLSPQRWA